jgi:hypothetical protein
MTKLNRLKTQTPNLIEFLISHTSGTYHSTPLKIGPSSQGHNPKNFVAHVSDLFKVLHIQCTTSLHSRNVIRECGGGKLLSLAKISSTPTEY